MKAKQLVFVFALLLALIVPLLPASAADGPERPAALVLQPSQAAQLTPVQPDAPLFMVTYACCLDDWQPGNCPVGTRVFATCTNGCNNCGPFSCVALPNKCFR